MHPNTTAARICLLSLIISPPVIFAAGPASFEQGKDFANSTSRNQIDGKTFEKADAEEAISSVMNGYTDNPEQVDTYRSLPPRRDGDRRIEECATADMSTLSPQEQSECDAINFLVESSARENPYVIDKARDPMMIRFQDAKNQAKGSAITGSVCEIESTSVTTTGSKTENCTEATGSQIFKCEEELEFRPAPGSTKSSEGTFTYKLNHSFMSSNVYRTNARSDFLQKSPPIDIIFSYNYLNEAVNLLKTDVRAPFKNGTGNVLFSNPLPTRYLNYTGANTDPVRKIFNASFSPAVQNIIGSTKSTLTFQTQDDREDQRFKIFIVSNGNDNFVGNRTFDGQELYPVEPRCDAVKCFSRENVRSTGPVSEFPTVIGYGELDTALFFQTPATNPERELFYTSQGGIRARGSRYAAPLEIISSIIPVRFYSGISSAIGLYDGFTKEIIAFSVGRVESNGSLLGSIIDPKTGNSVCEVNFGRVLQTTTATVPPRSSPGGATTDDLSLNDLYTPNWYSELCDSDEAKALGSRILNMSSKQIVPAFKGDTVYFSARTEGHFTLKRFVSGGQLYERCPTYLPPTSSLFRSFAIGEDEEETAQLRSDELTRNCTSPSISESQRPSTSVPNTESYAYYGTIAVSNGFIETYSGDCAQYRRRAIK